MATLDLIGNRFLISGDQVERKLALQIHGAGPAKDGVRMPANLLSWHQLAEAFTRSRHDYSPALLDWRSREEAMMALTRSEVWGLPDLWEHQVSAVERLQAGSVALFDDRGMGKTRTVVEAIRASQLAGKNQALVVAGKRIRGEWEAAVGLWWNATKVTLPRGDTWSDAVGQIGSAPITVVTYESIFNEDVRKAIDRLNPEWLIVDEAHNLKKHQRYNIKEDEDGKEVRTLTKSGLIRALPGRKRVVLSGSPMPNKWPEVWALLNIVAPEVFTSYWQFVETLGEVKTSFWGGKEISEKIHRTDIWSEIYDRWIIKRDRPDVNKTWEFVGVDLSDPEQEAYRQMQKEMRVEMNGQTLDASTTLVQATRLQQLAGGLGEWETSTDEEGTLRSFYHHADPSAKVDKLIEMLAGLKRAVVFTRFRDRAEFVAARIEDSGAQPLLITGDVSESEANKRLRLFASSAAESYVAVCTYGTVSEGINSLVAASDIFFLDWKTSKDVVQAADRLDRPGQQSEVRCVTLYSKGTVDELAIDREANKVKPLRSILRSPDGWSFLTDVLR